jgi:hypothetical protein
MKTGKIYYMFFYAEKNNKENVYYTLYTYNIDKSFFSYRILL